MGGFLLGRFLINDLSGTTVMKEWLAPEMHEMDDPISLPWEARRRNDIWAYGTLLLMIAQLEDGENQARFLHTTRF